MATLQKQGVPIPSKLEGPSAGPQSRSATPSRSNRGTAPQRATSRTSKSVGNRQSRNSNGPATESSSSIPNPVAAGKDAASGVGLLEAEFLSAIALLVLLMFSSDAGLTDKMMSVMKRGTLVCAVFFILAIVAGIGPRASKSAKAFGALVIVAILVTSDMSTVITDLDNIIKNDWIGVTPTDPSASTGSANAGTKSTQGDTGGSGGSFSAAERAALASIGEGDTLGKLFNPASEAKGTLDTVKAIGDTLTGLAKSVFGI